jgi:hypothetical protein
MTPGRFIDFPIRPDNRGNLTFVESGRHLPFELKRVFYLYDVPSGVARAGHALDGIDQVLVALSGSFDVVLDDGTERETVTLNRPARGLFIPSLVWRELENFSSGAVCLVFASDFYSEDSYYRTYEQFQAAVRAGIAE